MTPNECHMTPNESHDPSYDIILKKSTGLQVLYTHAIMADHY